MTTIAGVSTGAGCWLAGDSAVGLGENEIDLQRASKIWRLGSLIIGLAGSGPLESVLRTIEIRETRNPDVWGAELRDATHGLDEDKSECLIGCEGRLYYFAAGELPWAYGAPWAAIGSGALPAKAILRYTSSRKVRRALGIGPRERLRLALDQAEALTTGTRKPFRFLEW